MYSLCVYNIVVLFSSKEDKIMLFAGKWRELENIMFSEINQTQKDDNISSNMCNVKKDNMKVPGK